MLSKQFSFVFNAISIFVVRFSKNTVILCCKTHFGINVKVSKNSKIINYLETGKLHFHHNYMSLNYNYDAS